MNRNEYDVDGRQIELPHRSDMHYFDLWHGVELKPEMHERPSSALSFEMEAHGYGAVLAPAATDAATLEQDSRRR